jgi:hypothetical protein
MPHLVGAGAEAALHLLEYKRVGEIMDVLLSPKQTEAYDGVSRQ